jgi:hypothetical protein
LSLFKTSIQGHKSNEDIDPRDELKGDPDTPVEKIHKILAGFRRHQSRGQYRSSCTVHPFFKFPKRDKFCFEVLSGPNLSRTRTEPTVNWTDVCSGFDELARAGPQIKFGVRIFWQKTGSDRTSATLNVRKSFQSNGDCKQTQ